jgi:hypothetical protein
MVTSCRPAPRQRGRRSRSGRRPHSLHLDRRHVEGAVASRTSGNWGISSGGLPGRCALYFVVDVVAEGARAEASKMTAIYVGVRNPSISSFSSMLAEAQHGIDRRPVGPCAPSAGGRAWKRAGRCSPSRRRGGARPVLRGGRDAASGFQGRRSPVGEARDGTAPSFEIVDVVQSFFPDVPRDLFAACIDRYRALNLWGPDPVIRREGFDRLHAAMRSSGILSRDIAFEDVVDTKLARQAIG